MATEVAIFGHTRHLTLARSRVPRWRNDVVVVQSSPWFINAMLVVITPRRELARLTNIKRTIFALDAFGLRMIPALLPRVVPGLQFFLPFVHLCSQQTP